MMAQDFDEYGAFWDKWIQPKTTVPTTASYDFLPLKRGMKTSAVGELQSQLNDWSPKYGINSPHLTVDGDFGLKTETAVKSFQTAARLPSTGIVDAMTWEALFTDPTKATTAPKSGQSGQQTVSTALSFLDQLLGNKPAATTYVPSTTTTTTVSTSSSDMLWTGAKVASVVILGGVAVAALASLFRPRPVK